MNVLPAHSYGIAGEYIVSGRHPTSFEMHASNIADTKNFINRGPNVCGNFASPLPTNEDFWDWIEKDGWIGVGIVLYCDEINLRLWGSSCFIVSSLR
jgi:hypothetical protein